MTTQQETFGSMLQDTHGITVEPSVRNTFIDCHIEPSCAKRRNKSLPPSFRPTCSAPPANGSHSDCDEWNQTDDSTDVHTEASSDDVTVQWSETGSPHVSEMDEQAATVLEYLGYGNYYESCSLPVYLSAAPADVCVACTQPMGMEQYPPPPLPWMQTPTDDWQPQKRLNAKATAFQPAQQTLPPEEDHLARVLESLQVLRNILEGQPEIASVDVSQSPNGASVVAVPTMEGRVDMDHVLMLAKRALFQATEESKNVFVIGYSSPDQALETKAQGFEAHLTVMEHPQKACWRMFKHGSCSHGTSCLKEHPGLQVPVRLFVEAPHFQAAALPKTIQHCKQEFATFMMTVTSMLASSCGLAATLNSQSGDGWSIEIPLLAEYSNLQEHFLTRARDAFMAASHESKGVYVMGFGASPFISKSTGFVTMLGDMADQNYACWNVYTEGLCSRQCSCRWQHPQCLMPASVEFKLLACAADGNAEPCQKAPTASKNDFEEPGGGFQAQLLKEAPWNKNKKARGVAECLDGYARMAAPA